MAPPSTERSSQPVIGEHDGGHGLDDRHGARHDAGIVAALAFDRTALPCWSTEACGFMIVATGLKATRNSMSIPLLMPPWMPPRVIGRGADRLARREQVVVLGAVSSTPAKPEPISKPLTAWMLSIALPSVGVEPIEHRLAQARGAAADHRP